MTWEHFLRSRGVGLLAKLLVTVNLFATLMVLVYMQGNTKISALYLFLLVCSILINTYLLFIYFHFNNTYRDKLVLSLVEQDFNNSEKPILLFLRPFITDGKTPVKKGLLQSFFAPLFLSLNTLGGFESRLLAALEKHYHIVRFDDGKYKPFKFSWAYLRYLFIHRPGRYPDSSMAWSERVHDTALKASVCLIVPPVDCHSATSIEILNIIDDDLLSKTIFIMPPDVNYPLSFMKKIAGKVLWDNLLNITKNKIDLPSYTKRGGFVLLNGRHYVLVCGLSGVDWSQKSCIKKLFIEKKLNYQPHWEAIKVLFRIHLTNVVVIVGSGLAYGFIDKELSLYGVVMPKYLLITSIAFLLILMGMKSYYAYCQNFLLSKKQITKLFVFSLFGFIGIFYTTLEFAGVALKAAWENNYIPAVLSLLNDILIKYEIELSVIYLIIAVITSSVYTFVITKTILLKRKGHHDVMARKIS